jgi:hypothetical protein
LMLPESSSPSQVSTHRRAYAGGYSGEHTMVIIPPNI